MFLKKFWLNSHVFLLWEEGESPRQSFLKLPSGQYILPVGKADNANHGVYSPLLLPRSFDFLSLSQPECLQVIMHILTHALKKQYIKTLTLAKMPLLS